MTHRSKYRVRTLRFPLLLLDLALLALATVAAHLLRENLVIQTDKLAALMPYLAASLAVGMLSFHLLEIDRSLWRYSTMTDYLRIVAGVAIVVLGATLLTFMVNRAEGVSRSIPVLQFVLGICLLIGVRVAVRLLHESNDAELPSPFYKDKQRTESVLVVGLSSVTEIYLRSVAELSRGQVRVGAIIAHSGQNAGRLLHRTPIFGPEQTVSHGLKLLAVHGVFIDRIVVTVPLDSLPDWLQEELGELQAHSDMKVEFLSETFDLLTRTTPDRAGSTQPEATKLAASTGAPAFDASAFVGSIERPYWRIKCVVDMVIAGLALVLLSPVFLAVAIVVAVSFGNPVLFWQVRPGLGGRTFKMFKFRTMRPAYDPNGRIVEESERTNAVGRFLRRTRLDELPQLWNIFNGEMSFIGPRPLLPVDQPSDYAARLLVRPGLTGWAQVNGGRDISAADKAALDLWYVQNASLRLDLEILVRTVPILLFGERADLDAIRTAWSDLRKLGACPQEVSNEIGAENRAQFHSLTSSASGSRLEEEPAPGALSP